MIIIAIVINSISSAYPSSLSRQKKKKSLLMEKSYLWFFLLPIHQSLKIWY